MVWFDGFEEGDLDFVRGVNLSICTFLLWGSSGISRGKDFGADVVSEWLLTLVADVAPQSQIVYPGVLVGIGVVTPMTQLSTMRGRHVLSCYCLLLLYFSQVTREYY